VTICASEDPVIEEVFEWRDESIRGRGLLRDSVDRSFKKLRPQSLVRSHQKEYSEFTTAAKSLIDVASLKIT
jgi:hypothetical protein